MLLTLTFRNLKYIFVPVLLLFMFTGTCLGNSYEDAEKLFYSHYDSLKGKYRKDNKPRILGHGEIRDHAIVLIHGITDSPYYMQEIGNRFKENGLNVVLPLLDGHGLENPKNSQEEGIGKEGVYKDWKRTVERAVEVAALISRKTVSIGGLSTGGALSVYQVIDNPKTITGGVFLFSAALKISSVQQFAGKTRLLGKSIAQHLDKKALLNEGCPQFPGEGANPYKYPIFSNQGGLQLSKMISEINKKISSLEEGVNAPVFAAHSVFDTEAEIDGIINFLREVNGNRAFYILSDPVIDHASVVLKTDVELTPINTVSGCMKGKRAKNAEKNPHFNAMMDGAVNFFNGFVKG